MLVAEIDVKSDRLKERLQRIGCRKKDMEKGQETTIDMTTLPKNEESTPSRWETLEDNASKNGIWDLRETMRNPFRSSPSGKRPG
jgi:hypothetical protein